MNLCTTTNFMTLKQKLKIIKYYDGPKKDINDEKQNSNKKIHDG